MRLGHLSADTLRGLLKRLKMKVSSLDEGPGSHMIRTPNPEADPEWFAVLINSLVCRVSNASPDSLQFLDRSIIAKASTSADISMIQSSGEQVLVCSPSVIKWVSCASNTMLGHLTGGGEDIKGLSPEEVVGKFFDDAANTGSSFPSSNLWDGRPFFHTTFAMPFRYSTAASGWLSDAQFTLHGGETASENDYLALVPFNVQYTASTKGWSYPFDVKPVWITSYVEGSSTCTFEVRAEGTGVSSANISYTSQSGQKSSSFVGGTISAGDNISLAVSSGTAVTACLVMVGFIRFET